MSKKDHVFLIDIGKKERLAIGFCDLKNYNIIQAKKKIEYVLKKNITSYKISYLGQLDYSDMDNDIINQLHHFESHGEVWLFF